MRNFAESRQKSAGWLRNSSTPSSSPEPAGVGTGRQLLGVGPLIGAETRRTLLTESFVTMRSRLPCWTTEYSCPFRRGTMVLSGAAGRAAGTTCHSLALKASDATNTYSPLFDCARRTLN